MNGKRRSCNQFSQARQKRKTSEKLGLGRVSSRWRLPKGSYNLFSRSSIRRLGGTKAVGAVPLILSSRCCLGCERAALPVLPCRDCIISRGRNMAQGVRLQKIALAYSLRAQSLPFRSALRSSLRNGSGGHGFQLGSADARHLFAARRLLGICGVLPRFGNSGTNVQLVLMGSCCQQEQQGWGVGPSNCIRHSLDV